MKLLRPEDVYALDINSKFLGIDTRLLMENAGKAVADFIWNKFPSKKRIVIVAGLGNNGGDGFVAARHLAGYGYDVTVILLGRIEWIKSSAARENAEIVKNLALSVKLIEVRDSEELLNIKEYLENAEIIVDAILGVGLRGQVRGLPRKAIFLINEIKERKNILVISIDVPSGLDCYIGKAVGPIVHSDITITFHSSKKGLEKGVGGEVVVKKIGIPPEAEEFAGPGDVLAIRKLVRRDEWSHKGDFGRILIIGGSKDFSGAPALAGLASLRAGADLVVIAAPEAVGNIIRSFSPNLIVKSLPGKYLSHDHIKELADPGFIEKFDVILIGPGIGLTEESLDAAGELIRIFCDMEKPLIIDADALKSAARKGLPEGGKKILTPHAREFYLLFNEEVPTELKERGEIVKRKAREVKSVIVLKGRIDIVSDGERIKYNLTGNPGMTVGGTGDVLAGVIAAFCAISEDLFRSAVAGTFITGLAGDFAYKEKGYELLATDVIENVPKALSFVRRFTES
ncbi:MAG: NAD(P)H-hydrate dehydratase [Candidatus Njordarchaeales archaeon]